MKKRLLSLLLVLVMLVGLLPTIALADEPAQVEQSAEPKDNNGFVAQIDIPKTNNPANGYIRGYTFQPDINEYTVEIPDCNKSTPFVLTVSEQFAAPTNEEERLYYRIYLDDTEVKVGTKAGPYAIQTASTKILAATILTRIKAGEAHTLSIAVGTVNLSEANKPFIRSDRYDYYVTRRLSLFNPLTLTDGEKPVSVTPTYTKSSAIDPFVTEYTAVSTAETLQVDLGATDKAATILVGGKKHTRGTPTEITLADYMEDGSKVAAVPIQLKKGALETDYTLRISQADYFPVITEQPENNITSDKGVGTKLHIAATNPGDGTLSYQWYVAEGPTIFGANKISGAEKASYEPDGYAGDYKFFCVVTNTVDGIAFQTESETVSFTLNKNYLTPPKFKKNPRFNSEADLGIFYENDNPMVVFNLDCIGSGASIRTVEGVPYTITLFRNRENQNYGGEQVGFTNYYNAIDLQLIRLEPQDVTGEWYYYAVVSVSAEGYETKSRASETLRMYFQPVKELVTELSGSGKPDDPFQIRSTDDLLYVKSLVEGTNPKGTVYNFRGQTLALMQDITLPADWEPIGCLKPGAENEGKGVNVRPFSGIIDGRGHTLTVARDGKPLLNYVREASVRNLNLSGEHIRGYGLVDRYFVDYGEAGSYGSVRQTLQVKNVTIKSGTHILRSGFIGGYASGVNDVEISDCTIEKGVVIGDDGSWGDLEETTEDYGFVGTINHQDMVGSFAGAFNGVIDNCVSYATVYGRNWVGGIIGFKGQSMGQCVIRNTAFLGRVIATGKYVGGLAGSGYMAETAPDTPVVAIKNCYVDAQIVGGDAVGGLMGAEGAHNYGEGNAYGVVGATSTSDSFFYGTVRATAENGAAGGIIGEYYDFAKTKGEATNYYLDTAADRAVGRVITGNCVGIELHSKSATAEEFKNGTVLNKLNASATSYKNWMQGELHPVLDIKPYVKSLLISGDYKTRYVQGEALDLNGIEFTVLWSDDTETHPTLTGEDPVTLETAFDPNVLGEQTLTFRYGGASVSVSCTVAKEYTEDESKDFRSVTVYFTLSNDDDFVLDSAETAIAAVPITVRYFNLDDYGLSAFYCLDENGEPVEQPTVLHLYITAMERYGLGLSEEQCGKGALQVPSDWLTISGGAGHMYMTSFWNHDENLIYNVNGKYPMKLDGSMGATADEIILHDGDFVDVAMFSDWSFHSNPQSGFHFFSETQTDPQKAFRIPHGEPLTLTYLLTHSDMGAGPDVATTFTAVPGQTVYYGMSFDEAKAQAATTDAEGKVHLTFDAEGTWYIWTKGGYAGAEDPYLPPVVVSAPGCAVVRVTKTAADVETLIEAIGEVSLDSEAAIREARAAYDALTDVQKKLVGNYQALLDAETAYALLNQAAAEAVKALIGAIGPVTKKSGDKIDAARTAYDALTDEQKALVTNYQTLLDAEKRYEDLLHRPATPTSPSKPAEEKPSEEKPTEDASKLPFRDVTSGSWYYDGVQYAYENGLMNGTSANVFSPNADTTRGMIVTILARLEGVDTSGGAAWYARGREWAMENGISDGTDMEGKITREQLAAILFRYARLKGMDAVTLEENLGRFTDRDRISDYAVPAMNWAVGQGLLQGAGGRLDPQGTASRAQAATILMRFLKLISR